MARAGGILAVLALAAATGVGPAAVSATASGSPDPTLPPGAVRQLGTIVATSSSSYADWDWANPDAAYAYKTADGNVGIVRHDDAVHTLTVDRYNNSTLERSGGTTSSWADWPVWGGFYAGPDGYFYVLVGRDNPDEDDNLDVVAVRRYDPSWTLVGTAYLKGSAAQGPKGIYKPFSAGAAHMVLVNGRLVVHTSREMYAIDGVHHQSNLTFEVDTQTMTAKTFAELATEFGGTPYSSHSFQQLVAMNGTSLITVDHGDAYPREIQLGVMADYPTSRTFALHDLMDFNGTVGSNFTGASVTDLISGPHGIVVLGNSIAQPDAPNGALGSREEHRNAFAISAATDGSHTRQWLTEFAPDGDTDASEVRAAQVGDDRYAVLFQVHSPTTESLEYRLIDSAGSILASASFPRVPYSTISQPLLVGTTLYWEGASVSDGDTPQTLYLYGLDVTDPAAPHMDARAPKPFTSTSAPTIEGTPQVGLTLTARPGAWEPAVDSFTYQWYADGDKIPGATSPTLTPTTDQEGAAVSVKAVGHKQGYSDVSVESPTTVPVAPGGDGEVPTVTVSPTLVKYGQTAYVTISGTPGATVDLYVRKYLGSFTKIRDGLVLDGDGTTVVATRPDMNLRFQAMDRTVGQGSSLDGADGLMTVQKNITLNVSRVGTGRYAFTGSISPLHPGATVSLFRNGSLLRSGIAVSGSKAYSVTATVPAGTYSFQVRTGSTGYNAASSSPLRSVRSY